MKKQTVLKLKLLIAILTVLASLVLGVYTKVMFVLSFGDPFRRWLNLSLYVLSWLMLFVAAFFVGKEALALAKIYVKKKLRETYDVTVDIRKKGIETGIQTTNALRKKTVTLHKKTVKHGKKQLKKGVKVLKTVQRKMRL